LCGLVGEPNEGKGWPLARPEAFLASYNVNEQKFAAGIVAGSIKR
jgi:hypothetical protein